MEREPAASTPPAKKPLESYPVAQHATWVLRFLNSLKAHGKSRNTLTAYRNDLGLFGEFLLRTGHDPCSFDPSTFVEDWELFLREKGRQSAASHRRAAMAVRSFLHHLVTEGVLVGSPLLERTSPRQPNHDLLLIPEKDWRQWTHALQALVAKEADPKEIRDLCLVLLLGEMGLKVTEVASLTWSDILDGGGEGNPLWVRIGRGGEGRMLPASSALQRLLRRLQDARRQLGLSCAKEDALFWAFHNTSREVHKPFLHRHGVKFVLYQSSFQLVGTPWNAESLRNRAIFLWLRQGLPTEKVAELAGFSSLASLSRFSTQGRGIRKTKRRMEPRGTPRGPKGVPVPEAQSGERDSGDVA